MLNEKDSNVADRIMETLSASQLNEAVNFMLFVKMREENKLFDDLVVQSASSTDFWDNDIDDEVWNNA